MLLELSQEACPAVVSAINHCLQYKLTLIDGTVMPLQAKLEQRHVAVERVLEKDDAITELLSAGGSTAEMCVVCFADYTRGDLLRRLRCGHAFHCECVDRWCVTVNCFALHMLHGRHQWSFP